jgi:hypothetical protein
MLSNGLKVPKIDRDVLRREIRQRTAAHELNKQ